jgi:hypothetical protein
VPFRAAQQSRAVSPAMGRTSPRPWTGATYRRQLEVSCFSVTTRMRLQVNGTIGPLTILRPTKRDLPKAPAMAAARQDSGRPLMTFIGRVTGVPAAPGSWTASLSLPFAGAFGRPLVARRRALLQRGRARSTQARCRRSDPCRDLSAMTFYIQGVSAEAAT